MRTSARRTPGTSADSAGARPDEPWTLGVDVASKHLDWVQHGTASVKRIANSAAAIERWLDRVPAGSAIALESTGRYHQAACAAAHARGLTVYLLNPRDVRLYARSVSMRGKTDRLDAQVLARYLAHERQELRAWQPQPPAQLALDELQRQRALLVKCEQAPRQNKAATASPKTPPLPQLQAVFDSLKKAISAMNRQITQGVRALSAESGDYERIVSVPGIGVLTGAALLGIYRRLGSGSADAAIAFLGLDPRPMDSGDKQGVRRLSKRGPAWIRRLLFNAAMSASRLPAWKDCYHHELAKGLPRIAALNILARRLVRVAFALFKTGTYFKPKLAAAA